VHEFSAEARSLAGRTMHFAKRVLLSYLVVIALFTWFQRTMMYPAGRAEQLAVAEFPVTTEKFSKAADVEIVSGGNERIRGWFLQAGRNRGDRLILFFTATGVIAGDGWRGTNSSGPSMSMSWPWTIEAMRIRKGNPLRKL